jgi:predicted RNase H-like HicB family nuclease
MISRLAKSWSVVESWLSRRHGRPAGEELVRLRIHLEYDRLDKVFIAKCVDLPGAISYGATDKEALENLVEAITGVLNVRLQSRAREVVGPETDSANYHGRDLALSV